MSSNLNIDNSGIGGTPFLTEEQDRGDKEKFFTQYDLDDNRTAFAFIRSHITGKGKAGDQLSGKIVWVSSELISGTIIPALTAAQMRGIARFKWVEPKPKINEGVVIDGKGSVMHSDNGRYIVECIEDDFCDVWLG